MPSEPGPLRRCGWDSLSPMGQEAVCHRSQREAWSHLRVSGSFAGLIVRPSSWSPVRLLWAPHSASAWGSAGRCFWGRARRASAQCLLSCRTSQGVPRDPCAAPPRPPCVHSALSQCLTGSRSCFSGRAAWDLPGFHPYTVDLKTALRDTRKGPRAGSFDFTYVDINAGGSGVAC